MGWENFQEFVFFDQEIVLFCVSFVLRANEEIELKWYDLRLIIE